MSVYNMTPKASTGLVSVYGHLGRAVSNIHLAIRDWNDRRITRKLLGSLTDRELAYIGLMRGEIDSLS